MRRARKISMQTSVRSATTRSVSSDIRLAERLSLQPAAEAPLGAMHSDFARGRIHNPACEPPHDARTPYPRTEHVEEAAS